MPYAFHYDVPADEQFYRRVKAEIGDEQPRVSWPISSSSATTACATSAGDGRRSRRSDFLPAGAAPDTMHHRASLPAPTPRRRHVPRRSALPPCPVVQGSDRLTAAVSLVEQLLRTEAVFRVADPGSPAQFRARESADDLRYRLETLVGQRCLSK